MQLSQKKIDIILDDIYTELFKNANPSADWERLKKTGEVKKPNFFMYYYLNQVEQDTIINNVLKKYKIKDAWDLRSFRATANMGCSPNSCERTWKEFRNKKIKEVKNGIKIR